MREVFSNLEKELNDEVMEKVAKGSMEDIEVPGSRKGWKMMKGPYQITNNVSNVSQSVIPPGKVVSMYFFVGRA